MRSLAVVMVLLAPLGSTAGAQERPAPVAEFAAGVLMFADDGVGVRLGK